MNYKLLLLLIFTGCIKQAGAQSCGSCSVSVTGTNDLSYTISAGQTFCVDSTGIFTGSITLNGGTICNKGKFRPQALTLTSGSFYNYSNLAVSADVTVGSNVIFYCDKKSFVRIHGNFTINGGAFTNKGIANIYNTTSYTAGTFSNTGIFNCSLFSGNTGSIINTGIINKN